MRLSWCCDNIDAVSKLTRLDCNIDDVIDVIRCFIPSPLAPLSALSSLSAFPLSFL